MNEKIVTQSSRNEKLALRIEDAPFGRQIFFKRKMILASHDGECGWCGKRGQLWKMYPRGIIHHNSRPDGLIVPLEMCYSCCERELAEPIPKQLPPEAVSRFHPTDISFRRDRSNDIGHDGRPLNNQELDLYIQCKTVPMGSNPMDVGFVINDDATLTGKRIIRPGGR